MLEIALYLRKGQKLFGSYSKPFRTIKTFFNVYQNLHTQQPPNGNLALILNKNIFKMRFKTAYNKITATTEK